MLESSETEFASRYAAFAAEGELYPQPEGSPLLEFATGGRVLYLFDRTGPYVARPGFARVVVHGVLDLAGTRRLTPGEERGTPETLTVVGISGVEGTGEVLHAARQVWVVRARVPLVLAAFEPLPPVQVGEWVAFRTLPPLHGFLL
ncbi:hypothetical protein E5F05_20325 [Deinococcus metallilatus]|uniref:Uncharacterized protein n=1 Tax=Deinococcus metallilatus TaxID=1211322 RepID=A0AAJ5F0U2_9DEIO|nr:hypothetical protein [Deinococcus metallilatus]MBB5297130.1 hypothetical protein [Deinococcus metallilatus]QBY10083.1 hypothetical protein E5F05_20325 [Deinococcus metallilatus]RXJ08338.1 hypothetical protein ERJ73_19165 [Deinococcus metallilatus]TLK21952.1 hypothetical protein FCS05_18320 [Deinococcus metallilatus]GMA17305.1 hypothetical protein GCM10025871_36360 [Deinococcus metallilatus]